jgi:hypothetical protein
MPSITYLLLDAGYDPVFDPNSQLTDQAAVAQVILTQLRLFMGEWWENLNLGLPVFQAMLGQLAIPANQVAMQSLVQALVQGAPFVTGVSSVTAAFENGAFKFSASVQTAFGPVNVTNTPGSSASLDV